jgi:hypothetical protein
MKFKIEFQNGTCIYNCNSKTTISIGQKKEMTFCAYIFEAKHSNNNHHLPNNMYLKNVNLKYKFYKQIKKETINTHTQYIKNYGKVLAFNILVVYFVELINSYLIKSMNYKHI